MKGAAKCDTHCELQNSVNQQDSERILRSDPWSEHAQISVAPFFLHSSPSMMGDVHASLLVRQGAPRALTHEIRAQTPAAGNPMPSNFVCSLLLWWWAGAPPCSVRESRAEPRSRSDLGQQTR